MDVDQDKRTPDFAAFFSGLDTDCWAGGACTEERINNAADNLKSNYEAIVNQFHREDPNSRILCLSLAILDLVRDYVDPNKKTKVVKLLTEFVLGEIVGNKLENKCGPRERTFVGIDYQIVETPLAHTFDLQQLGERVEEVFCTFFVDRGSLYIAPYFVFVQSSGMGKTKLLYSYKFNTTTTTTARLVLCREAKGGDAGIKEKAVFDDFLALQSCVSHKKTFHEIVDAVFAQLDKVIQNIKAERIVLMFDEAHYLLEKRSYKSKNDDSTVELDALLFRMVRLWLCIKRDGQKIVAIFTGTTAKLTNFAIKDDLKAELQTDTRLYRSEKNFYERGSLTYETFYSTTTIGCLRKSKEKPEQASEYVLSIPYGRPLFATMTHEMLENGLTTIVSRMLRDTSQWQSMEASWLSILGTRAQMGQTSFEIASSLVAHSYANLVGVSDKSAHICFMPDPVCARLAMCLMDEKWSMELTTCEKIKGQPKKWWVSKLKHLYSKQLCSPEKVDLGEVFAALYFLFCADTIRSQKCDCPDYTTFSVPLNEWTQVLVNGGAMPRTSQAGKRKWVSEASPGSSISFGAIQVCRNYIRAYDDSWESLQDQSFLKNLYLSGIGFYTFVGCSTIDLVFPLQVTTKGQPTRYLPMFVSVKSHVSFGPKKVTDEFKKMKEKAARSKCLGALCLLVLFGSGAQSCEDSSYLSVSDLELLLNNEVVAWVLRVPTDDKFGLSEAFLDIATGKRELPEILASHSFLSAHRETESDDEAFSRKMLRLRPKIKGSDERKTDYVTKFTDKLVEELDKVAKS